MISLEVRHIEQSFVLKNGEFRCAHINMELKPPCCSPWGSVIECACQGMYSVWCPGCKNEDLDIGGISQLIDDREATKENRYD